MLSQDHFDSSALALYKYSLLLLLLDLALKL